MAKEIKDIQQIINDRADRKLGQEINKIYQFLSNGENYNLIKDILINVGTAEKPKQIRIYSLFTNDGLLGKIIEQNQERYRSEETSAFIGKVESIRNDVDQLMENAGQDY
jgi:hypothetical protein